MRKGSKQSVEARKKMSASRKGRVLSDDWRKKIGDSQRGKKKHPLSDETREKLRLINKGKKLSPEVKAKITASLRGMFAGDKHPNWKGGITSMNERIRKSSDYRLWRTAVFERDGYICVFCGKSGVYFQADHIKPFAYYPELRFAIDNGRTLCVPCHRSTDTYGIR